MPKPIIVGNEPHRVSKKQAIIPAGTVMYVSGDTTPLITLEPIKLNVLIQVSVDTSRDPYA